MSFLREEMMKRITTLDSEGFVNKKRRKREKRRKRRKKKKEEEKEENKEKERKQYKGWINFWNKLFLLSMYLNFRLSLWQF